MSIRVHGLLLAAMMAPAGAQTAWEPVWTTTWAAEGAMATHPSLVRRADDGTLFVGIEPSRAGGQRAGVSRLEADGSLSWTHERPGAATADDLLPMADGRVALTGGFSAPFVRTIDPVSGSLAWDAVATGAQVIVDRAYPTRQLAQTPDGDLLVRANDGGDFVVLRFDATGQALPAWRWTSGLDEVWANSIEALADGGAIVTGRSRNIGGGFRTVRFSADGSVVYADAEFGEIGNPLGLSWIAATDEDAVIVVASPETRNGVPGAMAWKIAADGTRLWTRTLSDQSQAASTLASGPAALAAGGDVLVVVRSALDKVLRVMRLDGATGATHWDRASVAAGHAFLLAVAPNGRILAGGHAFVPGGGGRTYATLAEFTADGTPCRHATASALHGYISAVGAAEGWSLLGSSNAGANLQRYDASGACTDQDLLFADDFEGPAG